MTIAQDEQKSAWKYAKIGIGFLLEMCCKLWHEMREILYEMQKNK